MARQWQVTEIFQEGKNIDQSLCEDKYVISDELIAVIDGATDKSGLKYELEGKMVSGGLFAASMLVKGLMLLPKNISPPQSIAFLSEYLDNNIRQQYNDIKIEDRPSAAIIVFNRKENSLYWVGDCKFAIKNANGLFLCSDNEIEIDKILGSMRALTHLALASKGQPWDPNSGAIDPGREVIMPFLRMQGILANSEEEYGYGILNGLPVPNRYIGAYEIQDSDLEIVLASDGYPQLVVNSMGNIKVLTLEAAETRLEELLTLDPLCVKELKGNKGLQKGQLSYDDRTWIKINSE